MFGAGGVCQHTRAGIIAVLFVTAGVFFLCRYDRGVFFQSFEASVLLSLQACSSVIIISLLPDSAKWPVEQASGSGRECSH